MSKKLTEQSVFTPDVVVPETNDRFTIDSLWEPLQALTNRTRDIYDVVTVSTGSYASVSNQLTALQGSVATLTGAVNSRLNSVETKTTKAVRTNIAYGLFDASFDRARWDDTTPRVLTNTSIIGVTAGLNVVKELRLPHGALLNALKLHFIVGQTGGSVASQNVRMVVYECSPNSNVPSALVTVNGGLGVVNTPTTLTANLNKTIDQTKLLYVVVTPFIASSGQFVTTLLGLTGDSVTGV